MATATLTPPTKKSFFAGLFTPPTTLTPEEKSERQAQKQQREAAKLKEAMLAAEAQECANTISLALDDLDICFRYRKEKGQGERVKRIKFRSPFPCTEETLYLPVDLRPRHRPRGVGVQQLMDEETLRDLSITVGRRVEARYTPEDGFFYIIYRQEGARGIPLHVKYDDMIALRPSSAGPLAFPLGMTEGRRPVWASFDSCPAFLVSGTTGGGKSNMENVIISTLISQNTPDHLKLCLIDFKRVELSFYRNLPHVATFTHKNEEGEETERKAWAAEFEDAIPLMGWIKSELRRRALLFEQERVKKIGEYNFKHRKKRLPYILLAVDEWNLFSANPKVGRMANELMIEIARLGRFCGICTILCTQYPKKEVLDSLIKVVMPGVIAFPMPNLPASVAVVGTRKAYDIGEPGRFIYQLGRVEMECQAPLLTNETLEELIKTSTAGEHYTATLNERHDVAPTEIFLWALDHNGGKLDWRSLVNQYGARGFSHRDAIKLVSDYESQIVVVNNSEYKIRKGSDGVPARLLPVDNDDVYTAQNNSEDTEHGPGTGISPTPGL